MEDDKIADEPTEAENEVDNDEQESGNTAEEETSTNDSEESKDKTKDDSDENKDSEEEEQSSESEEENPYEAKLKKLEEDNKELKTNKTNAIKEERGKRKKAEDDLEEEKNKNKDSEDDSEEVDEEEKPLTRKEVEDLLKKKDDKDAIKEITSDESERKLITKYVDDGYSVDDAYLKANEHIIKEHKEAEREREDEEAVVAGYSKPVARGKKGAPAYATDPILKKAAEGLTPEERKHLTN